MDLLPRLQNGLDGKIEKTLRVGYDGLRSEEDKALFHNIACLFNGARVAYLKLLLADSGLSVKVGLQNLADKSLIHISWGYVIMPSLLQEMGRHIVRIEEPEIREFLVDAQDICDLLSQDTGTHKILGVSLDTGEIDELYVHKNAFKGMRNLRFLEIDSKTRHMFGNEEVTIHLPENFDYLPHELKLLCWPNYPMRCLPSKFRPEKLVKFKMVNSKLEKLWEGIVALPCLKKINLWGSVNLIEMPNLSKATNLKTLKLVDCYSLVKLPSSIPHPNKLKYLYLSNCRNVETIPTGISLKSLEVLNLNGCSRLKNFPQISTNISYLSINRTSIEELPSNLSLRFENLSTFQMHSLKKLSERVQGRRVAEYDFCVVGSASYSPHHVSLFEVFASLVYPNLGGASFFISDLHKLAILEIRNCENLETLPTRIYLQSLRFLDLNGCSKLRTFPDISTNIEDLNLSKTAIEEVPPWIEKFTNLHKREMKGCVNLETLPIGINLPSLECLNLSGCSRFRDFPDISTNITYLNLSQTAIEEVPCWIEKFTWLHVLKMDGCNKFLQA